jgi:predicted glycoside hydrolase/deacetylase ChbG (UPF0249 family)
MALDRFLIINADGYGFTPGVNAGIIKTFEAGIVSSTSCTPNFGFLDSVGQVQKQFPEISFGVHFNLSVGKPLSSPDKVRTLLNGNDEFVGAELLSRILRGVAKIEEMEVELEAQAAILKDQGIDITHMDGHQNRHLWPVYFEACLNVAKRVGIRAIRSHRRLLYTNIGSLTNARKLRYYAQHPSRLITHAGGRIRTAKAERQGLVAADRLITPGYVDDSHKSMESFWRVLAETLPRGYSEIYCHPGYPDDILRANAYYVEERAEEMRILSDPSLKQHYTDHNIRLMNFRDLVKARLG